jgi:protein involved in sex pheromone biosynthesis
MKKHIALGLVASTLFLAGCCTTHHVTQWEYKTYRDVVSTSSFESGLNKLASEGWIVDEVLTSGGDNGYTAFLLKRPKQ